VRRKTKIVATLGPAVDSEEGIRALIEAGLNVARFNFSHGDHESHRRRFEWVRRVAEDLDLPVATLQDVQGPKIRVGTFPAGQVALRPDSVVDLVPGEGVGDAEHVHVAYLDSVRLEPGAPVLLSDGMITLECVEVGESGARARVVSGGELLDHRGVAFPGSPTEAPVVTDKDRDDLAFGQELGFDFVAASFISSAADIREIRALIGSTPVIAKIETAAGYRNLDDILTAVDGVMVARGDLGVELSLESVPRAQSEILNKTNVSGKLSITATEMLESMVHNPRPTRAEVTDVYRSVIEDTDAVMLSAETAIGEYPEQAVRAMDIICREAEASPDFGKAPEESSLVDSSPFASVVAQAAVDTSNRLGLDSIVAFTETGSTARLLSKYRPHADIYAYTSHDDTYRRMALYGGVTPLPSPPHDSTDSMLTFLEEDLQERGIAGVADPVVMVAGTPPNIRATTNLMKLHRIGATTLGNPEH
jgi:pyruvate kinase